MPKRSDRNIIVGLDVGTSKVVALVGALRAAGTLELIGLAARPSRGLRKGGGVHIDATGQSSPPAGASRER